MTIKSDFKNSAEGMKYKLGQGLCLAKWKQVSLHLSTGLNHSCYHPALHDINPEQVKINPAALHNTDFKKDQRKIMLKHERPKECGVCWQHEDAGHLSDRHYRSSEPWAAVDFDAIKNSTGDEDWVPSYVEVNFSSVCNLKCSYCSPQFSSSWMSEVQALGGYPTNTAHNDPAHFIGRRTPIPNREDNPYVEAFWKWWPTLYPELKHFRMTGGEPLMDPNTYRVFDYVLANPKSDLHLAVTSNFSVEPKLFDRHIEYVKRLCDSGIEHYMQYVSIDSGIAGQAEYIRHGLDFQRLKDNVERYLSEVTHHNSITFIVTVNNLSITGLQPLMEWIQDLRSRHNTTYQRVWMDTPALRAPSHQSIALLSRAYQLKLARLIHWMSERPMAADSFVGFKDYEIDRMKRVLSMMREEPAQLNLTKGDFYKFFSEHDRRRGTDFLETFPEMREFWQECKYYAETLR